jgi:hypothetical protein
MLLFYKLTFRQRQWPTLICLLFITLIALGFRLWVVADANLGSAGSFRPLVGDEPGYDYLAYALLQGEFFQWPGRTPVYPLFLAAIYAVFGHS